MRYVSSVFDLEELANDFEALQKENVVLKSKMKVLVDKIEEYRTNESALNQAILSAQKLSVQIENDARTRSANIVAEAEAKAAALLGNIDDRIAQEESRLQAAKLSSAKFFDSARELCQKQLQTLYCSPQGGTERTSDCKHGYDRIIGFQQLRVTVD